jgi:hypothetical protein
MAPNRAPAYVRKARLRFGPATLSWMSDGFVSFSHRTPNLLVSEPRKNEKHMTGSAITASVIVLVVLALPAVAAARIEVRSAESAFARQTGDLPIVFGWQAPKSKGKTNAHVYHGGPKAND